MDEITQRLLAAEKRIFELELEVKQLRGVLEGIAAALTYWHYPDQQSIASAAVVDWARDAIYSNT